MKKSVFHFVLMVVLMTIPVPFIAFSATSNDTAAAAGSKFVELLATNDFAEAVMQFDGAMQTAMPQSKLRETWRALETQAGAFQKQLQVGVTNSGGYDVALVSCQFERATLDVKVVFDAMQRIAGLFFVNIAAAYATPVYADTHAFREMEFTVGHGQWQLRGTLTLPKNGKEPWPAIVLVHGSGPEDQDETIGDMREHDPLAVAREIRQPMFFLQGQRDYQVTVKDYEIWKAALTNHPRVIFKLYPQLNHLFVTGKGKSTPAEYEQPGHVEEQVVADIARWILEN